MNHFRQACCLIAFAAGIIFLHAESAPGLPPRKPAGTITVPMPPPVPPPPVEFFRQLLAMKPVERIQYLTNRPPAIRERILEKVREYQAMDPDDRELRLRATEVRWYLTPFLHSAATNHAAMLANVPEDIRDLIKTRVDEWDALSPSLRDEFLDNERTLQYFSHVDAPNISATFARNPTDAEQARWNALSEDERKKMTDQFDRFFELTTAEKQKTLNTLPEPERLQMEKTLEAYGNLPAAQRFQCIRNFTKFAGMSPADRAEFLKNAERWSQMSPKERQAWRDLISHVPQWPPLPPGLIMPPVPPLPKTVPHPTVATNL